MCGVYSRLSFQRSFFLFSLYFVCLIDLVISFRQINNVHATPDDENFKTLKYIYTFVQILLGYKMIGL